MFPFPFSGRTLDHVLTILRDIDSPAYKTLSQKFRHYASCVGLVDTGYFRKRSTPTQPSGLLAPQAPGERVPPPPGSLPPMAEDVDGAVAEEVGATIRLAAQEMKSVQALLDKVYRVKEEIDRVRQHLVQAEREEQDCAHGDCSTYPTATDVFLNWLDSYRNDAAPQIQ
jgi:hypothetical protein